MHYSQPTADARQIIRTLRVMRGFASDRALAAAAGVNQPTLARYLAGTSETMEVGNFMAIAHTLGVTISELLGEVPLSNGSTVREIAKVMARMTPDQQQRLLRVGRALADEEAPP